ncbi:MAG: hypothetical protein LBR89_03090 [Holosporales bacterium]|jgi:hypothetical protein|nr:hypothetical protein [Holosporales bacterium]
MNICNATKRTLLSCIAFAGICASGNATEHIGFPASYYHHANQDQADINRCAIGGTFLPDYFEPFLRADNAIRAVNRAITEFNTRFPSLMDNATVDATAFFEQIDTSSFDGLIEALRVYMSRTATDEERDESLTTIFDVQNDIFGVSVVAEVSTETAGGVAATLTKYAGRTYELVDKTTAPTDFSPPELQASIETIAGYCSNAHASIPNEAAFTALTSLLHKDDHNVVSINDPSLADVLAVRNANYEDKLRIIENDVRAIAAAVARIAAYGH